ncbi:MAG: hypothetical protein JWO89_767, partial [Verrucomicrobiaceae bacterium]|nr:hypothetical protein [Verrucomicrobiaceae bacterium]
MNQPSPPKNVFLKGWLVLIAVAAAGAVAWWQGSRPIAYTHVPASSPSAIAKASGPIMEDEAHAFAEYAGDATCKACHAGAFDKWAASHHGLAERPLNASLDKAAFEPAQTFSHGSQKTTVQGTGGKAEVITLGFGNKVAPFAISRVIGHDPLRQFLVTGEAGRVHTMEATWDPNHREWFNVYGNEDRQPGEWGHWTGRGMVWNTMCASCHNTRVRKNYDAKADNFHTTMAQMTVSCEACHGPMKAHVVNPKAAVSKLSKDQTRDTCAQCHSRRSELTGDFKPGDNFFDHHYLAIPDHSDIFYPDGQIRDEDYEFSAFLGSRMHNAGVRCIDCHDPHTSKPILPGNSLCMRCHTAGGFPNAPVIVPALHTFHQPESTGSQCVNCHMPQTVYMQRHSRHDHGFTIPDPLMTQQFGIPNACNKCHTDKDVAFTLAAVEKWYGPKMDRRYRQRTTVLAKAKRGDEDAREGLLSLLKGDETPYWKASACLLLDRWLGNDDVRTALQEQLKHAHPLVRESAVRSLEPLLEGDQNGIRSAIEPLVNDPVRSVRTGAAWALRDSVDLTSTAGKELLHMLAINSDQPSGQMQQAQFDFARHNAPLAITHMQRAIQWDPNSPPFHHDLAVMYSVAGNTQAGIQELQEAIRLNPREAEYQYKLGLAWAEVG